MFYKYIAVILLFLIQAQAANALSPSPGHDCCYSHAPGQPFSLYCERMLQDEGIFDCAEYIRSWEAFSSSWMENERKRKK